MLKPPKVSIEKNKITTSLQTPKSHAYNIKEKQIPKSIEVLKNSLVSTKSPKKVMEWKTPIAKNQEFLQQKCQALINQKHVQMPLVKKFTGNATQHIYSKITTKDIENNLIHDVKRQNLYKIASKFNKMHEIKPKYWLKNNQSESYNQAKVFSKTRSFLLRIPKIKLNQTELHNLNTISANQDALTAKRRESLKSGKTFFDEKPSYKLAEEFRQEFDGLRTDWKKIQDIEEDAKRIQESSNEMRNMVVEYYKRSIQKQIISKIKIDDDDY